MDNAQCNDSMTSQQDLSGYQGQLAQSNTSPCPYCGYCPHCGRRNVSPFNPYWPPVYWGQYGTMNSGVSYTGGGLGETIPVKTSL